MMLINITRYLTIIILSLSAVLKFFSPHPFLRMLLEIGFKGNIIFLILILFILVEIVLVYFLVFKFKLGMRFAFWYMLILTISLIVLWLSGIDADCGCFGGFIQAQIGPLKIVQNVALISLLAISLSNLKNTASKDA